MDWGPRFWQGFEGVAEAFNQDMMRANKLHWMIPDNAVRMYFELPITGPDKYKHILEVWVARGECLRNLLGKLNLESLQMYCVSIQPCPGYVCHIKISICVKIISVSIKFRASTGLCSIRMNMFFFLTRASSAKANS